MTAPAVPPPVPDVVVRIAAGRPLRAIWVNDLGDVTFRVGVAGAREFVKMSRTGLSAEAARLRWAAHYLPVPRVLGLGDDGRWLHTAGLPGVSAVHPRWLASPREAVRAVGAGLRALHDRAPVDDCPFGRPVHARLAGLAPKRRAALADPPPIDKPVVCHGDACAPNTVIGDDGRCCGHVDLGELGVADRWADLAVSTMSLGWNYAGGPWDGEFFTAYGVEPDARRIDYYRRLWNAGDISTH